MVMKMDSRLNMDTLNQDILNQDSSSLATLASGDVVLLPSADFVTDAALVRHNDDLILTLPDGREFVVEGYFAVDPRPTLSVGEGDMALTPELVSSFLQDIRFEGEGSATAVDGQGAAIGNAETVIGDAFIVRDGERIALEAGEPVFQGDIVETETGGSVKLRFVDETVFSISEDARLALDKMVFDPATSEGESLFSMLKGGFLFISGQIAKTDPSDMQVVTPVATIGIRGTIVTGSVNPGEAFEFSVIDGAIAVQPQGADAPIVMSDAFATLGGTVSETGAISVATRQSSAQEVVERNAGQFATLSDADVSVIESAVLASATENGAAIVLDLQEIVSSVVSQANESGSEASGDSDEEPAVIVELEPVAEPEPEPVVLEAQTTVEVLETGLTDSDSGDDSADDDIGTTVIEEDPGDTEAPAAPVITTSNGATLGRDVAILSGTAEPGSTVTVVGELDGDTGTTETVTTTAAADGSWSVDLGEDEGFAADGETYSYTVTATDQAGNVSEPASIDLALKFTPLAEPTLDDSKLTNGYIGDDFVLSGTSPDTDTVTVTLTDSAGSVVYEDVPVDNNGDWSLDLSDDPTDGTLDTANGNYKVTVTAADDIGNSAESDPIAIKIDHVDPELTIDEPAATLNSENSTISGTVSENATVTVTLTGNDGTTAEYQVTPISNGSGGYNWTLDLETATPTSGTLTKDGTASYDIEVTTKDAAGNEATPVSASGVTTDFTAPSVEIDQQNDVTLANSDTTTTDDTTITGTADTDEVTVTLTDGTTTFTYDNVTVSNGTWSLDLNSVSPTSTNPANATLDTAGGTAYSVTATAKDDAGNTADTTITGVNTDFTPPEVSIAKQGDDDLLGLDEKMITGTADTDEVTVTITDPNNSNSSYEQTVEVDKDTGTWELNLELFGLDEGTAYDIEVKATDGAGNSTTEKITGVTTDFTAPDVTVELQGDDNLLGSAESTIMGTATEVDTVTVKIMDGDTVVYENDAVSVDASSNNGAWSLDLTTAGLDDSGGTTYDIEVTATDDAGNSTTEEITDVTIDLVDPEVETAQTDGTAFNDDNHKISGTSTDAETIEVTITETTQGSSFSHTEKVTVNDDGTWELDLKTVPDLDVGGTATYDITVTATDAAGNQTTDTTTGVTAHFLDPIVTIEGVGDSILASGTEIGGTLENFAVGTGGAGTGNEKVTVTFTNSGDPNDIITYNATIVDDQDGTYSWVLDLENEDPIDAESTGTLVTDGTATYDITINATDDEGDKATALTITDVTTDFDVPVVTLDALTSSDLASSTSTLSGTSTDPDTVTVTLTGDDNTTVEYEVTPKEDTVNGGYTWTLDLETATPSGTLDTTGNTTYSIKVTTEDAAGNPSDPDAADANATAVTTDFEAPEVGIDQQDNATLANSDTTTSDDTTITGTATGTDKVTVTIKDQAGNTVYEAVDLDATGGTWALDLSGITALDQSGGTAYDITVTASDTVGNQATQAQITGVTTDFEAPTVDIVYADGYAIAAHDPLGGDVSGADTVTVTLTDGTTTFTYNDVPIDHNTNTWSLDLNDSNVSPDSIEPAGSTVTDIDKTGGTPYNVTVTAKDAAGNEDSVTRTGITTDFVDPTVGFSALADGTTALADNAVLNTNDMTLNGTSDGANSITVTLSYTDAQQTQQEIIYTSTNGDVTLNQDGTWSVDLASNTELDLTGETDYTITATATDAAGNTADTTTITGVTTDFTAPTVGFNALSDGSTALANDAVLNTNDTTLTGTSDGASSITVTLTYMDGQDQKEITYTNITPEQDGTWSVDLTSDTTLDLTGGTDYTITATATDAAGNTTDTATITGVNTDFTAPSVGIDQQGSITLANSDTTITDDTTLTGTSTDGEDVIVTLDDGNGGVVEYEVTPTGDATNGYTWSLDLNDPNVTLKSGTLVTDGTATYKVSVTTKDAAGNEATAAEITGVTTDFEGPVINVDTTALKDGTTATGEAGVISGTATDVDGDLTVTLSAGGTDITYTVAVNGDAWTLDLNTAIPDNGTEPLNVDIGKNYTLSVTATDALGNSGASPDQVITINQSASITYTELGDGDGDLDNTTPIISGTVEPGSTVSIVIYQVAADGSETIAEEFTSVTVETDGSFSQTASALTVGEDYRIEIKTTDPAGNTNDVSETVTVTLPKTTLDGSTSTDFSTSATGVYVVDSAADENIILTGADDEVLLTGGGTDTVNAGDGDDLIRIGEAGVETPFGSKATVDAGAGENTIEIESSINYFSTITITGGDDKDIVTGTLNDGTTADISTGAGDDEVTLHNIRGKIDAGEGDDKVDVTTDSEASADIQILAGNGDDEIGFSADNSTLNSVRIDGGDGENTIAFQSTGGSITTVEIDGGDNKDVITVTSDETGTATNVTIDAKDGTNTVTLNNKTGNYSNVNITGGSGSDSITAISAAAATVNIEAGAGDDTLYLTDVSGAVNAGEGDDTIIFDEVSAGLANLALDAGDGDDTVEISHGDFVDLAAGSNNTLSGGNGTDELVITGIASGAAVDASFATGFESIKLMAANSTGSSLSLGLDNTQSLVTPSMTGSADTLVLDGAISGINSITASGGITATIQNSDNAGTGLTVDDITVGDNSHLTLEADAQVTGYGNYDYSVTDLNIGENASLTLQSDKSDANNGSATDNGTSYLLDVNGTFNMTESSTLNVDLLNLSGNDLINATTVLDLGNTSSASLAGTLNIYANDGIDDTGASSSQLIANTSGAGGISSTFDEILFLDANGNNLVGTDVENGSDQALIPLYDQYSGLTLNAVSAEEISGGSTYTTNGQADAAFFSNDGTALRTEEANVSLFGSNDQDDTFEVAGSATSIGYYDGGEGGNDTLKLSGDQHIGFHDEYSATGIMDYQVNRIETLDISTSTGYSANSQLSLSSAMVKAMTEDTNYELVGEANALILKVGQGGIDKIDLSQWGNPGSASANGTNYTVYEKDGAKLYIDES